MPAHELPPAALAAHLADFDRDGAVVLPNALSSAEVELLRGAFDANRARLPLNWTLRGAESGVAGGPTGESGRWQCDELLRTETDAVALVARHPLLMQLATALIGPACRFSGVGAMLAIGGGVTQAPLGTLCMVDHQWSIDAERRLNGSTA
jgi:hypothetical protein